jgi:hypothetical protein
MAATADAHNARVRVVVTTALLTAVVVWNVRHGLEHTAPRLAEFPARYFADVSIATHLYRDGEFPVASYGVRRAASRPRNDPAFESYVAELEIDSAADGISHGRPFAVLTTPPLPAQRVFVSRRDDSGRAYLLGLAFRLRGGVAPYLLFWMATLVAIPVLWWIAFETASAGIAVAGQALIALVALSAYATDMLGLSYSAAGFYLVAVLALVAHAVYACRRQGTSVRGVIARSGAAGLVLAVGIICRSGTMALLPFFLVSALLAARRGLGPAATERAVGLWLAGDAGARREIAFPRWSAVLALSAVVLVAPLVIVKSMVAGQAARTAVAYGLAAEAQEHDVWVSLWEGLGDFDRSHGHAWQDKAAREAAGDFALGTPRSERALRALVLASARGDPLWYAGILVKRAAATLSQWKLLPWHPLGGRSMRPATTTNEGVMDAYYGLTAQLDWFRFGPRLVEAPLPLLWAMALAGAAVCVRTRATTEGLVLAIVTLATLALPVAVTTAGALETQAIAVAYFLAIAIATDALVRRSAAHRRKT